MMGDRDDRGISARAIELERFWAGVVPALASRVPLFRTARPWRYPFLKKTNGGITLRLNVKLDHTSVWLQVHQSTPLESEAVYRRLLVHQDEIRRALPEQIGWDDRPAGGWDSLLLWMWSSRTAGLTDVDRWPTTQAALVDSAAALIDATLPFLPPTSWSTTTSTQSSGNRS